MHEHIVDFLTLDGKHTRSISLLRDLNDEQVAEGYHLTPNSVSALRQIGESLNAGRAQRAWKVVGPYGSGKSAFGVILAQLLCGESRNQVVPKQVKEVAPEIATYYASSNRLTVAVIGSRMSFGHALALAIGQSLLTFKKNKRVVEFNQRLDLDAGLYKSCPLNSITGEMIWDFASLATQEGYEGVLLLVDEVGKFAEHAALYPEHGDLIALQQVAEVACSAKDNRLAIVAMLHQHLASYAAGVGRALNDEWHKVSARYEEIPFDEPIERYAHFAKHALGVKPSIAKNNSLAIECKAIYARALEYKVLRFSSDIDKALFSSPEGLYPLHPVTLAALAIISKLYGQSERSLHAYLKGNEPFGLRDFASRHQLGEWFRVEDLYDQLASGHSLRIRDLGIERRWEFAKTAISLSETDELTISLIKSLAVIELVRPGIKIPATAEFIAFAIGKEDIGAVNASLDGLVEKGVLLKRYKKAEYGLAVSEAVNIEALYERTAAADEHELIIKGISSALSSRQIVANRHYGLTGTIRTMGVIVGTVNSWPQVPKVKSDEQRPDAWLKIVLFNKDSQIEEQVRQRLRNEIDELCICAGLPLSNEGRANLAEFSIWQTILSEVNNKRLDPWTTRYVEARLQEVSERVQQLVTSALMPSTENNGLVYWHCGDTVPNGNRLNTSQLASWLFDKVYHLSPYVVNELVNKDRPASAIVLARQRMFDFYMSNDPLRAISGENEYPPERLIHNTLVVSTGIWREKDGRYGLYEPLPTGQPNISNLWREISKQLSVADPISFDQLLAVLASPPWGVRAGPAGIWVAIYLLANRAKCAVFERGTLILEMTSEHLQRMYKNPQNFTLRELPEADESRRLLADYRIALSAIGCVVEVNATYLETARELIRWFYRLPEYTKQTTRIGKDAALVRSLLGKATDPIELLSQTLLRAHHDSKSKGSFSTWLTSVLTDLGMAYRKLQEEIASELGRGFGINGPLSSVRAQLQSECTKESSKLADAKLKAFILRCMDLIPTDEKWLDSVGSLVVQRSLDSWSDDTIASFQEGLTDLCGRYLRWMKVVTLRGKASSASGRYIGVTLTTSGGEEVSVFSAGNEASTSISKNILENVILSAKGDKQLAAISLAQALIGLQEAVAPEKEKKKTRNG